MQVKLFTCLLLIAVILVPSRSALPFGLPLLGGGDESFQKDVPFSSGKSITGGESFQVEGSFKSSRSSENGESATRRESGNGILIEEQLKALPILGAVSPLVDSLKLALCDAPTRPYEQEQKIVSTTVKKLLRLISQRPQVQKPEEVLEIVSQTLNDLLPILHTDSQKSNEDLQDDIGDPEGILNNQYLTEFNPGVQKSTEEDLDTSVYHTPFNPGIQNLQEEQDGLRYSDFKDYEEKSAPSEQDSDGPRYFDLID